MAEAQTYLSKCISQKRSIYSNRTVSYVIVLLELLTVLLEYIDLSVIAILISKNSYYYTNILPIMLALCSMLSGTYYAHNYASIIGGSLSKSSTSCLQDLRWPALHTRQSYFTITQVHNILHDRVSIPFNSHFKFSSTNTRSHSLSLTTSSSTINAYHFSFFINSPFLWNSVPVEILQISKAIPFRMALRQFLLS